MRIFDVRQGSEQWEQLRHRPTASKFKEFCTPVRGDWREKQAKEYAREIVSKRMGVHVEPPPSYWMMWGTETEDEAIQAYMDYTGREVTKAGFVMPDHTDDYGCSPDGLVTTYSGHGMVQVKCPKPETLMRWRDEGVLPPEHKPQIQGELWVSGLEFNDFFAYHPGMKPFLLPVIPDLKYHQRLDECMQLLLAEIARIEEIERGE